MPPVTDSELDDPLGLEAEEEGESEPGREEPETPTPPPDESRSLEATDTDSETDADYSKRVQKRIDKEVYRRKAAEEREARITAELATLRADLESVKSRNAAVDAQAAEGTLQDQLRVAAQRLRKAKEEGDIDAELKARDEYDDLKAHKRALDWQRQQPPPPPEAARPAPPATAAMPAGTAQWLERNPWYLAGEQPRLARMAAELDAELQAEGFSPADSAMYGELNRRLKAALPKAATVLRDTGGGNGATRPRDSGPPSGASSADGNSLPAKKRSLTQNDLEEMKVFGLNPTLKEDRLAWLRAHS